MLSGPEDVCPDCFLFGKLLIAQDLEEGGFNLFDDVAEDVAGFQIADQICLGFQGDLKEAFDPSEGIFTEGMQDPDE